MEQATGVQAAANTTCLSLASSTRVQVHSSFPPLHIRMAFSCGDFFCGMHVAAAGQAVMPACARSTSAKPPRWAHHNHRLVVFVLLRQAPPRIMIIGVGGRHLSLPPAVCAAGSFVFCPAGPPPSTHTCHSRAGGSHAVLPSHAVVPLRCLAIRGTPHSTWACWHWHVWRQGCNAAGPADCGRPDRGAGSRDQ